MKSRHLVRQNVPLTLTFCPNIVTLHAPSSSQLLAFRDQARSVTHAAYVTNVLLSERFHRMMNLVPPLVATTWRMTLPFKSGHGSLPKHPKRLTFIAGQTQPSTCGWPPSPHSAQYGHRSDTHNRIVTSSPQWRS
ncbi:hypothetical protein E2C01_014960 [Portunus trituberculatus]|uniref:Uncharacterized protein n=1 Tax=Portunus trituberculatus TaxID=210409 RepID=A0A5B7DLV3_PORTR|nr:hypothetical protein [Portunus trituberculatus]